MWSRRRATDLCVGPAPPNGGAHPFPTSHHQEAGMTRPRDPAPEAALS